MENSFWILNNESEDYSALDKSIDVEYLIVGAGLTGLHTKSEAVLREEILGK